MVKIQQVAALRTELFFYLVGYPRRSIAYGMDVGARAKARLGSALKELSSRRINVALQGASIRQCLAALGMSQTDFGFLPVQFLAFALVALAGVRLNQRHHPAVHFDDQHLGLTRLRGPIRL